MTSTRSRSRNKFTKVILWMEFLEPTKAIPMLAIRSPFKQTKVCARQKLKQEPDQSTNQISGKKMHFDMIESTKSKRKGASTAFKLVSPLP